MQNETRRSSGILRYLPREQRNEEQRKTRLLHITTHLEGKARARRGQLLPIDVLITTLALNASCNTQNEDLKGNGILTLGQSKVKLVVDASVPSRVATATSRVRAIVRHTRQQRLTGDMVQVKEHWPPTLKTSPGPGAVGTGSARTRVEPAMRTATVAHASVIWCILKRESAMGVL